MDQPDGFNGTFTLNKNNQFTINRNTGIIYLVGDLEENQRVELVASCQDLTIDNAWTNTIEFYVSIKLQTISNKLIFSAKRALHYTHT